MYFSVWVASHNHNILCVHTTVLPSLTTKQFGPLKTFSYSRSEDFRCQHTVLHTKNFFLPYHF
uniref:Uncharacterized protein n=1 Tax=Anguilla anguilla TaxID=7936 RepID=A0A0E9QV60_ANGAN